MEISSRRSEFSVFVTETDVSAAQSLVETLKATGYQGTHYYPTFETLISAVQTNPPHLVLVDCNQSSQLLEKFLVELAGISNEILVILMITPKQAFWAMQLVSRGLAFDFISRPFVSSLEIVQKLDRGAVRLYFQFESEQLKERFESKSDEELRIDRGLARERHSIANDDELDCTNLNQYLARMLSTKELEPTIQIYMETVSRFLWDTPILYFRYLPSHGSLVVSQAVCLTADRFRGIGIELKEEQDQSIQQCLRHPDQIKVLRELMSQVFQIENYTAISHVNDNDVVGVFVIFEKFNAENESSVFKALQRVFELTYKRNVLLKEKHALDIADSLTGLYNRKYFSKRLDEEISRSRRILMPVSIVTLDLDGIQELNERLGFQQADAIVKAVGSLLKKTTRNTDVIARLGVDEFVCILPHTEHAGAVIKAERIRRMIESAQFPLLDKMGMGPLTVSLGVSEYPSFAGDAESLIRSADEAMMQVKSRGGNQVCLATAPIGFQMDFEPRVAPAARSYMREESPL